MIRTIIRINPDLCNGCGVCIDTCSMVALDLIDGKAHLIDEVYCDGAGACMAKCPQGAISFTETECEPYSEIATMKHLTSINPAGINNHLKDLKDHNELVYFHQGVGYLKIHNIEMDFTDLLSEGKSTKKSHIHSYLRQWPIQLQLINPENSIFADAEMVVAADCVAYAYGNFHQKFIKGHSLCIACPKLDSNQDIYLQKLISLINVAKIRSINVVVMEVPCCSGLLRLVESAISKAERKIPLKKTVINVLGEIEYK